MLFQIKTLTSVLLGSFGSLDQLMDHLRKGKIRNSKAKMFRIDINHGFEGEANYIGCVEYISSLGYTHNGYLYSGRLSKEQQDALIAELNAFNAEVAGNIEVSK